MEAELKYYVKTDEQINTMRKGGKILSNILNVLKTMIKPGIDVYTLEEKFLALCEYNNVLPSCKGYAPMYMSPFPTGLCVSINSQSVHCYPKKGVILNSGDLVTVDTVIKYSGLHVDSAFAVFVGNPDVNTTKLMDTTRYALESSIKMVKPGAFIGDLSYTMQNIVESAGFGVLKDYAGHGIGTDMHEIPEIPCYGTRGKGFKLLRGLTICIEALVSEGKSDVVNLSDWETSMKDGKRFLQFEHTILVTDSGFEILTNE